MAPSEAELIAAASAGDRAAIDALLRRHQPDVRRFARRVCRTSEDADDAVQHTLLQLANGVGGFRGAAKLATWLFTVVRRECTRLLARARRDALDDRLDERLARTPDPELRLALERALAELDPPLRQVLLLRDVEERTGPDVAAELGITLEAMKTRLHHARSRVRASLAR